MIIENILKLSRNLGNPKNIGKFFCDFWNNRNKLVFIIFSLIILLIGGYFWYGNIYRSGWNGEKKLQYKNAQNKEILFRENEFDAVVEEIRRKKQVYEGTSKSVKDIFEPYAGEKK